MRSAMAGCGRQLSRRDQARAEVASRLLHDRRRLDERLQEDAAQQAAEIERRVGVEVEARETASPASRGTGWLKSCGW